jgi:cellobiose phosphorylase
MYPWLTGSASWYLLTLLSEVFGVKGDLGDLVLEPRLVTDQFDAQGEAVVRTQFAGRDMEIIYRNPRGLDHDSYTIACVSVGGAELQITREGRAVRIGRSTIGRLACDKRHRVVVALE